MRVGTAMRREDYFVATVLPMMQHVHETSDDRIREFTVEDAKKLNLDNLPLLWNHSDGKQDVPYIETGRVRASSVVGANAVMLASIDPESSSEATVASNCVATGFHKDVSLGNDIELQASNGVANFVKTPTEVSTCREGLRYGSRITNFFPGRSTLRRMALLDPADLTTMAKLFGYDKNLAEQGIKSTDDPRYIEAFATLSDTRLAEVIARDNLRPRAIATMSAQASASIPEEPAAPIPPQATAPVPTPPQATAPVPPQAVPPATDRSVTTPSVPNVKSLEEMTNAAYKYKEEAVQRAKELVEERQRAAELNEKLAAQSKIEKELEELRAERTAAKAKEAALRKQQIEQAIKGFVQNARIARFTEDDINDNVARFNAAYEKDPELALDMVESTFRMAQRAALKEKEYAKDQAVAMQSTAEKVNEQYYAEKAKMFASLNAAEAALQTATYPPTSVQTRMTPASSAATTQTATAKFTVPPPDTPATQEVGKKRLFEGYVEKQAQPHFTVKASADQFDQFPAQDVFANLLTTTGKIPTMSQVAAGDYWEATGKMQAGADGGMEMQYEKKRLRTTPARIEPSNFAPAWQKLLDEKLAEVSGRPRFSNQELSFTMTEAGYTGEPRV